MIKRLLLFTLALVVGFAITIFAQSATKDAAAESDPGLLVIFLEECVKALSKLVLALVTLALGWFVGNRLSLDWNLQQKRKESDLAAAHDFHSLYGEFFAV